MCLETRRTVQRLGACVTDILRIRKMMPKLALAVFNTPDTARDSIDTIRAIGAAVKEKVNINQVTADAVRLARVGDSPPRNRRLNPIECVRCLAMGFLLKARFS